MDKKQGITTESSIYRIENGFLLTYVVCPYGSTVCLDTLEHKTEYYKTCMEATERLSNIQLEDLTQQINFIKSMV